MMTEQRSDQWFEQRKGKITSSEIHKIMGTGKGEDGLSETAKTYLLEKVAESLGGASPAAHPTGAKPAALEWGTELEDLACEVYQENTGIVVTKASFIPVTEQYGGSPDGLVEPGGVIEIKCPFASVNHFKHMLIKSDAEFKKTAPNYYYQCISNMICAKADWCDFISYDPRVDSNFNLFVYRLNRNEEEVQAMLSRVETAVKYMNDVRERLEIAMQPAKESV